MNLHLTPAGVALMKELVACAARTNADARGNYSEQEIEALFRLLRGVTVNLEKAAGVE